MSGTNLRTIPADPVADPRAQNVVEKAYSKLEQIVEKIVVLRVTTVIGTVTVTNAGGVGTTTAIALAPEDQIVAHLSVDTALGNTDVLMSKAFMADAALMAVHKQAVADALTIRKESIEMLKSAIAMIVDRTDA